MQGLQTAPPQLAILDQLSHHCLQKRGDRGIEKLWSSANVKIYDGGVNDDRFLRRLSDLIGSAEVIVRSQSVSNGTRTLSRSIEEKAILIVAELRELPQGRAVAFPSGTPAILIEPKPGYRGPDAAAITAHSPT